MITFNKSIPIITSKEDLLDLKLNERIDLFGNRYDLVLDFLNEELVINYLDSIEAKNIYLKFFKNLNLDVYRKYSSSYFYQDLSKLDFLTFIKNADEIFDYFIEINSKLFYYYRSDTKYVEEFLYLNPNSKKFNKEIYKNKLIFDYSWKNFLIKDNYIYGYLSVDMTNNNQENKSYYTITNRTVNVLFDSIHLINNKNIVDLDILNFSYVGLIISPIPKKDEYTIYNAIRKSFLVRTKINDIIGYHKRFGAFHSVIVSKKLEILGSIINPNKSGINLL